MWGGRILASEFGVTFVAVGDADYVGRTIREIRVLREFGLAIDRRGFPFTEDPGLVLK